MELSHQIVSAPGAQPEGAVIFLHGILGSGPNLRTIARRMAETRPDLAGVLVDLRAHGGSLAREGEDSVGGAAADVAELARSLALPTVGVFGHSFGGKVALALLARSGGPRDVIVVDSNPGVRPDRRGSEGTVDVVDMLGDIGATAFATRAAFVEAIEARGRSSMLAQWLAQSLRRESDGTFRFGLDVSRIRALLDDYFALDLWPTVESPPGDARVHLVIGARSSVLDDADRKRAMAIAARGRVSVTLLDTEHWVHVEDPDGLLAVLLRSLRAR